MTFFVRHLPKRFFVTGTDTDVGKTFVSAILARGLCAKYWKPVQTGPESAWDRKKVQKLTGLADSYFFPERFSFPDPVSPHAAAEDENISILLEDFILPEAGGDEFLLVEGAGGVLTPLSRSLSMADLIRHLNLPAILVTRTNLGTLNHTRMAVEALLNRGIELIGLVALGPDHPENLRDLPLFTGIPLLTHIPWLDDPEKADLMELFRRFTWPDGKMCP